MLYALSRPTALVALVAALVVGLTAYGAAQTFVAARLGDRAAASSGRTRLDPRRHLDPLGLVAAVLSGVCWVRPVPIGGRVASSRVRFVVTVLAGPLVTFGLAVGAAATYRAAGGLAFDPLGLPLSAGLRGQVGGLPVAQLGALLAEYVFLGLTLVALVPLPPLDGGRLLFALGPQTAGWRRAQHWLGDGNWGAGILLALILLGSPGLLLQVLDAIAAPLLRLLS